MREPGEYGTDSAQQKKDLRLYSRYFKEQKDTIKSTGVSLEETKKLKHSKLNKLKEKKNTLLIKEVYLDTTRHQHVLSTVVPKYTHTHTHTDFTWLTC